MDPQHNQRLFQFSKTVACTVHVCQQHKSRLKNIHIHVLFKNQWKPAAMVRIVSSVTTQPKNDNTSRTVYCATVWSGPICTKYPKSAALRQFDSLVIAWFLVCHVNWPLILGQCHFFVQYSMYVPWSFFSPWVMVMPCLARYLSKYIEVAHSWVVCQSEAILCS